MPTTPRKLKRRRRPRKKASGPLNGCWGNRSEGTRNHIHSWGRMIIMAIFLLGFIKGYAVNWIVNIVNMVNAPFFQEIGDQQQVIRDIQNNQDKQWEVHREDIQEVDEDMGEIKEDIKEGFKEVRADIKEISK